MISKNNITVSAAGRLEPYDFPETAKSAKEELLRPTFVRVGFLEIWHQTKRSIIDHRSPLATFGKMKL